MADFRHLMEESGRKRKDAGQEDDLFGHALHRFGSVREGPCFLAIIEQIEQGTGLAVVVFALSMIVAVETSPGNNPIDLVQFRFLPELSGFCRGKTGKVYSLLGG